MSRRDDDWISRRDALKVAAGVAVLPSLLRAGASAEAALAQAAAASFAPRFFTADELAMVDELAELIIPADDHSPGARAAKVAGYIDGRLANAFLPTEADVQQRWRTGLARVDELSREMNGTAFMASTPDQRAAVLTRMAGNEASPTAPEELFFRDLKGETVRGYYTSKVGIHDEMEYKGNTMLAEFAGDEPTD